MTGQEHGQATSGRTPGCRARIRPASSRRSTPPARRAWRRVASASASWALSDHSATSAVCEVMGSPTRSTGTLNRNEPTTAAAMAARSAESAARWPTGGPAPSARIARPVLPGPPEPGEHRPRAEDSVELDSTGRSPLGTRRPRLPPPCALRGPRAASGSGSGAAAWTAAASWTWPTTLGGHRARGTFGASRRSWLGTVAARGAAEAGDGSRSCVIAILLLVAGCSADDDP